MKAHLMFRDTDFDLSRPEPDHADDVIGDLGLATVGTVMSGRDDLIAAVTRAAILAPLREPAAIEYRQGVLADCLANEDVVRDLYALADRALRERRASFWSVFSRSPSAVLSSATGLVALFAGRLRDLRAISDAHAGRFGSDGFRQFFTAVATELDDAYLAEVDAQVSSLGPRRGLRFSAGLGRGNKSTGFVVRTPPRRRTLAQVLVPGRDPVGTVIVPDRDEGGARELQDLRDQAVNPVANAVAQASDHLAAFFTQLRLELAFYLGAVRLHRALTEAGVPVCMPAPVPVADTALSARGLYDPALPLRGARHVVGNDLDADGRPLIVVTGANQGGKSTFLRAVALATLLASAGLPAPATRMRFSPISGVFTHYRRSEDPSMVHGKFAEELSRLRDIVQRVRRGGLVAFNESFAATNEREGADVAVPVLAALLDEGVRVMLVTHSVELADRLRRGEPDRAVLLRAERAADGSRPFTLIPGPALATGFGEDLYRQVFG